MTKFWSALFRHDRHDWTRKQEARIEGAETSAISLLDEDDDDIAHGTVGQSSQQSGCKYWVTRSSACLFAHTPHSFAGSALLASFTRSFMLTCSLAHSLARKCMIRRLKSTWFCPTVRGKGSEDDRVTTAGAGVTNGTGAGVTEATGVTAVESGGGSEGKGGEGGRGRGNEGSAAEAPENPGNPGEEGGEAGTTGDSEGRRRGTATTAGTAAAIAAAGVENGMRSVSEKAKALWNRVKTSAGYAVDEDSDR